MCKVDLYGDGEMIARFEIVFFLRNFGKRRTFTANLNGENLLLYLNSLIMIDPIVVLHEKTKNQYQNGPLRNYSL